jgi:hypothetical protein
VLLLLPLLLLRLSIIVRMAELDIHKLLNHLGSAAAAATAAATAAAAASTAAAAAAAATAAAAPLNHCAHG